MGIPNLKKGYSSRLYLTKEAIIDQNLKLCNMNFVLQWALPKKVVFLASRHLNLRLLTLYLIIASLLEKAPITTNIAAKAVD